MGKGVKRLYKIYSYGGFASYKKVIKNYLVDVLYIDVEKIEE